MQMWYDVIRPGRHTLQGNIDGEGAGKMVMNGSRSDGQSRRVPPFARALSRGRSGSKRSSEFR